MREWSHNGSSTFKHISTNFSFLCCCSHPPQFLVCTQSLRWCRGSNGSKSKKKMIIIILYWFHFSAALKLQAPSHRPPRPPRLPEMSFITPNHNHQLLIWASYVREHKLDCLTLLRILQNNLACEWCVKMQCGFCIIYEDDKSDESTRVDICSQHNAICDEIFVYN